MVALFSSLACVDVERKWKNMKIFIFLFGLDFCAEFIDAITAGNPTLSEWTIEEERELFVFCECY